MQLRPLHDRLIVQRSDLIRFQQPNSALAATWILGAGLIGLLGNVTSLGGAAMVLGVGLVPPMLLMLQWTRPIRAVVRRTNL